MAGRKEEEEGWGQRTRGGQEEGNDRLRTAAKPACPLAENPSWASRQDLESNTVLNKVFFNPLVPNVYTSNFVAQPNTVIFAKIFSNIYSLKDMHLYCSGKNN